MATQRMLEGKAVVVTAPAGATPISADVFSRDPV